MLVGWQQYNWKGVCVRDFKVHYGSDSLICYGLSPIELRLRSFEVCAYIL